MISKLLFKTIQNFQLLSTNIQFLFPTATPSMIDDRTIETCLPSLTTKEILKLY